MRHLMSPLDLSVPELEKLLDLASDIEKNPKKYAHTCDDRRLATLSISRRTRYPSQFSKAADDEPWRKVSWFLICRFQFRSERGNLLPIPFVLFPAMQISVLCVIPKKALRW